VSKVAYKDNSETCTWYEDYSIENNNAIQFFIICIPKQQPQGQSQTQHRADIHNYIMDKLNIE
jgi:hypothetical protein